MGQAPSSLSPFDVSTEAVDFDVPEHELVPKTVRIDGNTLAKIQRRIVRGDIAPFLCVPIASIFNSALRPRLGAASTVEKAYSAFTCVSRD